MEEGRDPARHHADDGRQPHVLPALERQDGAEHGEPEEQDGGKLVRPDQRSVEHEARHHARGQDRDLRQHEYGSGHLDEAAQPLVGGVGEADRRRGSQRGPGVAHDRPPALASSVFQACSPNLPFHSA